MDILTLEESLKQLSFSAQTLNSDERFELKLRLLKLKEEQKLHYVQFWGKILGTTLHRHQEGLLHRTRLQPHQPGRIPHQEVLFRQQ